MTVETPSHPDAHEAANTTGVQIPKVGVWGRVPFGTSLFQFYSVDLAKSHKSPSCRHRHPNGKSALSRVIQELLPELLIGQNI